jgi:hypothetical protein
MDAGSMTMAGDGNVIVEIPLRVASVSEVAVIVTITSLAGASAGATYITDVLVGLLRVPAPESGAIDQVTPLCAMSF